MNTTTWNIFQSELRGVAAKILGSNYGDWFDNQHGRIVLWWNAGESVESWHDVVCVESHTLPSGWVSSVTNHRTRDFDKVCADLLQLGATQEQQPKG